MARKVEEKANVPVVLRRTTYSRLDKLRVGRETFDDVIAKLITEKEKPSLFTKLRMKK